jgi:hypothetical protein
MSLLFTEYARKSLLDLYLYRYQDQDGESKLHQYPVIKETEHGYWIETECLTQKLCKKEASKSFAYLKKEDALYSYIQRKRKQYRILKYQQENVEQAFKWITENTDWTEEKLKAPPRQYYWDY